MAVQLNLSDLPRQGAKRGKKMKRKNKTVDELLERPEVSKLQELDRELTAVADDESKPVERRIKEYEELLAGYKDVMEKLKKYGSTSILIDRSVDDDDDNVTQQLENLMKREGVKFEKDCVHVPLKKEDKTRQKRLTVSYSRQTFEKVMNYIKSTSKVYATHLVRHVAQKLFELVKDKIDVARYPGFANISQANSASFTGVWSRL